MTEPKVQPFKGKTKGWTHWCTPEHFLDRVRELGPIGLDPFSNPRSKVNASVAWGWPPPGGGLFERPWCPRGFEWKDSLKENWRGYGLVFCNPPYGKELPPCIDKMCTEGERGTEIVALIPSSTDTKWWHKVVNSADAGVFVQGRIAFDNPPPGSKGDAPSMVSFVAYWGPQVEAFFDAFGDMGAITLLRDPRPFVRAK